jgi:hypothetical protein
MRNAECGRWVQESEPGAVATGLSMASYTLCLKAPAGVVLKSDKL